MAHISVSSLPTHSHQYDISRVMQEDNANKYSVSAAIQKSTILVSDWLASHCDTPTVQMQDIAPAPDFAKRQRRPSGDSNVFLPSRSCLQVQVDNHHQRHVHKPAAALGFPGCATVHTSLMATVIDEASTSSHDSAFVDLHQTVAASQAIGFGETATVECLDMRKSALRSAEHGGFEQQMQASFYIPDEDDEEEDDDDDDGMILDEGVQSQTMLHLSCPNDIDMDSSDSCCMMDDVSITPVAAQDHQNDELDLTHPPRVRRPAVYEAADSSSILWLKAPFQSVNLSDKAQDLTSTNGATASAAADWDYTSRVQPSKLDCVMSKPMVELFTQRLAEVINGQWNLPDKRRLKFIMPPGFMDLVASHVLQEAIDEPSGLAGCIISISVDCHDDLVHLATVSSEQLVGLDFGRKSGIESVAAGPRMRPLALLSLTLREAVRSNVAANLELYQQTYKPCPTDADAGHDMRNTDFAPSGTVDYRSVKICTSYKLIKKCVHNN